MTQVYAGMTCLTTNETHTGECFFSTRAVPQPLDRNIATGVIRRDLTPEHKQSTKMTTIFRILKQVVDAIGAVLLSYL